MNTPAFDQILRRLTEAEVKFVVVGGLALGAWGVVRGTKDVDIVVAPDAENLKRLAAVARQSTDTCVQAKLFSVANFQSRDRSQVASRLPSRPTSVVWTSSRGLTGFPPTMN